VQESPLLECRRKDRITNCSAKLLRTKKAKGLHASENGLHASCERRSVQVCESSSPAQFRRWSEGGDDLSARLYTC